MVGGLHLAWQVASFVNLLDSLFVLLVRSMSRKNVQLATEKLKVCVVDEVTMILE